MKNILKTLLGATLFVATAAGMASCNFLDVVPDETATAEDAFKDRTAALRYLYSCYSYLPQPNHGTESIDFMTGDEIVSGFNHETFESFPEGNFNSTTPVISYWTTFFRGLRQCYLFLEGLPSVPDLTDAEREDYIAQTKFLIGYYHFLLIRCYGPVILIDGVVDMNIPVENYAARTPLDECVQFTSDMLDEAAAGLPARRASASEYGLATSVAAKAVKAKLWMYAASPLFNGGTNFYTDLKNDDGTPLMPQSPDPSKWDKCRQAMLDAIQLAESNGYALYTNNSFESNLNQYPEGVQRVLRYNVLEEANPEIIFADSRDEGYYGLTNKSVPYGATGSWTWNGVAPTWQMVSRFYTKNGLPYDEDPEYKDQSKLDIVTIDASRADQGAVGRQTIRFHLDREPRFYAWIAFQGGYYELLNATNNGAYTNDPSYSNGRLVCDFVNTGDRGEYPAFGNTARNGKNQNISYSCYLNKKAIRPTISFSTGAYGASGTPWPIIRLADLYLGYAEACVETNQLDNAKVYLNKVRSRAGIPDVETSWAGVATLTQDKLREIVRNERMIELYLENQNFWDMRRWLLAADLFNSPAQGLNCDNRALDDMAQVVNIPKTRQFRSPANYLMPIPVADLNNNPNLVNNPGY